MTNDQISERLNDAEKVIGESPRIINDIKFAMKRDVKKEVDEAYQRGVEDGRSETWEAARKIGHASQVQLEEMGFEFNSGEWFYNPSWYVVMNYTVGEAIAKLKAYEEQKTDDEIKVGDELEHTVSGYTSKAIFLEKIGDDEDEDWYKCLFWTGCGVAILSYPKSQFKRTGKHYDIDKILEAMKE